MKLVLKRTYGDEGTNGDLYADSQFICHTIELPWKGNQTGISCIPEGTYKVIRRTSEHHKKHLHVLDVPGRDLILIHKANDAQEDLRGCIGPVVALLGDGKGYPSKPAFLKLYGLVDRTLKNKEEVTLEIVEAK
jgi:hypothetical protein